MLRAQVRKCGQGGEHGLARSVFMCIAGDDGFSSLAEPQQANVHMHAVLEHKSKGCHAGDFTDVSGTGMCACSLVCPRPSLHLQIVRLASGMRHVVLSFDTEESVREAVAFLRRAHPLAHTAPIKKSQVRDSPRDGDYLGQVHIILIRPQYACPCHTRPYVNPRCPFHLHLLSARHCLTGHVLHSPASSPPPPCVPCPALRLASPQIHHALCDMLACILLPLVRSDAPQRAAAVLGLPALEGWYAAVMTLRNDITTWMNKHAKHINVSDMTMGFNTVGAHGLGRGLNAIVGHARYVCSLHVKS